MSSGRRGRGGADRGARGAKPSTRGGGFRDNHNGSRSTKDGESPSSSFSSRGERGGRGNRGGTPRGGANNRGGDRGGKSNFRERGGFMNSRSSSSGTSNSTPNKQDDFSGRLRYLKDNRENERQRFIREGRMNPDGQMQLKNAVRLVGICQDMCPEFERVRRIVEGDLKAPEHTAESLETGDRRSRVPDESRMVKAYQRSAAGMDVELVSDIRTPSACLKTMRFMSERLDHEDFEFLYGWIWDRSRAVRKDLRTQLVSGPEDLTSYLECFEECARLLLLCAHHMSLSESDEYFQYQDLDQLNQTNLSLKERYQDNRGAGIISPNEAEFQAYRLILCLHTGDEKVEDEIHSFPNSLLSNRRLQTAIQISRAGKAILKKDRSLSVAQQNWQAFWDLVASPAVSYLMACAAEVVFNRIRHIVLDAIWRAYRQGNTKQIIQLEDWTIPKLIQVLGLDSSNDVYDFCEAYGFSFKPNSNGDDYLDTYSVPWTGQPLQQPNEIKPQFFSRRLVESKRYNRSLSAVIRGMSVLEARKKGLIFDNIETVDNSDADHFERVGIEQEDSLFVPENPSDKANNPSAPNGFSAFGPGTKDSAPALSPFANPFQPKDPSTTKNPFGPSSTTPITSNASPFAPPTATSKPNPFAPGSSTVSPSPFPSSAGTSWAKPSNPASPFAPAQSKSPFAPPQSESFAQAQSNPPFNQGTRTSPATGQEVKPGLFDAAKNSIKFSSPSFSSGPFTSSTPATSTDSTRPVSQSDQSSGPTLSSPFSSFKAPGTTSESRAQQQKLPSFSFASLNSSTSQPAASVSTSASPGLNSIFPNSSAQRPSDSGNSTNPFPSSSAPSNQDSTLATGPTASLDQEKTKKEEEKQKAQEETRRAQEEQQRRAQAEAELRAREERERLEQQARAERERLESLERQQREQAELKRVAAINRRNEILRQEQEKSFDVLANSILMQGSPAIDEEWPAIDGLLPQFIENFVQSMYEPARLFVAREKAEQRAAEMIQKRKELLKRTVLSHWYNRVLKKKRASHARNRRRWLKENAEQLMAAQNGSHTSTKPPDEPENTNGLSLNSNTTKKIEEPNAKISSFQMPTAPASIQRNEVKAKHNEKEPMVATSKIISKPIDAKQPTPQRRRAAKPKPTPTSTTITAYTMSTAPIDRTETDWFALRARGIDPSKYRKRSHDFDAEEDQGKEVADRKRARIVVANQRTSLPPPTTDEERIARFRAVRDSLNRPQSFSASRSVHEVPALSGSPVDRSSRIIAEARSILSVNGSPSGSPPQTLHEFSRSVPDLGLKQSGGRASSFGQSNGNSVAGGKAAYWGRVSRFVPQHLYGKGPEAIRDYLGQSRGSNSTAPSVDLAQPLELSSPIPAPGQYLAREEEYIDDDEISGEEDGDMEEIGGIGEADDEDMGEEDDLDEEEEADDSGLEYDSEDPNVEYDDYEEEYEEEEFEEDQQNNQFKPGATQDDAIELSD